MCARARVSVCFCVLVHAYVCVRPSRSAAAEGLEAAKEAAKEITKDTPVHSSKASSLQRSPY